MMLVNIVDDEPSIRESLAMLLNELGYETRVFEDGQAFIEGSDLKLKGCVILDNHMPRMGGEEVQRVLIERKSPLSIIYLTGKGDVRTAVQAIQLGAVEFLEKPVVLDKLTQSVEKGFTNSLFKEKQLDALSCYELLTHREKQILQHVITGKKNKQIADELFIAIRTMEIHKSSVIKKFSVKNVAELVTKYSIIKDLVES